MQIDEKNTLELDEILQQTDPTDLDRYLQANAISADCAVADYLSAQLLATRQKRKDVIARAGLSEQYGYQLLNGARVTSDRDKILGLCIGAGMDLEHTNRALKLAGFSPLYSKLARDVVLISCIQRGISSVMEVNEILEGQGIAILNLRDA